MTGAENEDRGRTAAAVRADRRVEPAADLRHCQELRSRRIQGSLPDILLQIWKNLDSYEGRAAPSTWVYRVALNTAISYRRKNGRRVETLSRPLEGSCAEPAAPAGTGNEILILEEFLRSLGGIDRAVFLLYLEDLSYRQIAEVSLPREQSRELDRCLQDLSE